MNSDVLNLVACASSFRKDFATCEMIMSEKHTFLVSILDGMDRKFANIGKRVSRSKFLKKPASPSLECSANIPWHKFPTK